MALTVCQGKEQITIHDKICPQCGAEIEIFSIDVSADCPNCGFTIYNNELNCVQWCQYAEQCVGPEQYKQYMAIMESQKKRKAAEASEHF